MVALVKIFTQSAAEYLDEWFESEQVKVTLATDGVIGANGGPRSPGTAYILLHHCMGGVAGHRGCGALCAAAWARFRSYRGIGPCERRNHSRECRGEQGAGARRPRLRRGAAERRGDRSGRRGFYLDPKLDFSEAARGTRSRRGFPWRRFATTASKAQVVRSISRSMDYRNSTAYPGAPGPHHRATMHICPSIEYVERAWDDAKYGRASERPLLELTVPTMYDPSLARRGSTSLGHLSAIRAIHAARRHVGRIARNRSRPCDRAESRNTRQISARLWSTGRC